MKSNVMKMAWLVFALFFMVLSYLTYIQIIRGNELLNHPRNRRLQLLEENVTRGRILDRGGRVLAETASVEGQRKRVYPFGKKTAPVTGYVSRRYGQVGLEAAYNSALLGLQNDEFGDDFWSMKRVGSGTAGNDVVLSLDIGLQQLAYNLLGNRQGAVVAMEPATGRILAMVSKPGFDPNDVEKEWQRLSNDETSPFMNRATQGLYPPGSTMKVVTAAGILAKKPETINRIFDVPGYIVIEGRRIEDRQAVGKLDFTQAFAKSSNAVFAELGLELGFQGMVGTAENFGLNKSIPFELPVAISKIPTSGNMSRLELGETAIGQGRVLVTPLAMALVASAVANGGRMMAPKIVDEIRGPGGVVKQRFQSRALFDSIDRNDAEKLSNLMAEVVSRGTGTAAAVPDIRVAGKTGSAENAGGQSHAWFIGFAPLDQAQVAVSVIIENGGAGGREAAPIAREIIKTVIRQKR